MLTGSSAPRSSSTGYSADLRRRSGVRGAPRSTSCYTEHAGSSSKTSPRRASAAARRLRVLSLADVRAPGGALTLLTGFRERQMREQAIGRSAMPVHRIWRDVDRVARVQHLRLFALETDAADTGQTEERLPNRMRVPRGAGARRERNDEPPRRDGASAVITGSWNTTPVKVSAAPRLVFRAPARMTPALTGMTVLLQ